MKTNKWICKVTNTEMVAYICEYCGVTFPFENDLKYHERECNNNPVNRHCYSCKYWKRGTGKCDIVENSFIFINRNQNSIICYCGKWREKRLEV